ncbi:uncharacterized protein MONOS_17707 [Monocercomonoides exilis]|uniref:uncharacterized protein n=1 Tax=Monocercomonoides exilis TaxID=2049356 RepID=UPI00355A3604|nr:hypothetical protein MONOS_17707 [Monocercomonoides exilis]
MGPVVSKFINELSKKPRIERFSKLISGLRNFNKTDQKEIIKELESVMKAMDKNELKGALTVGVFEEIKRMIEDRKLGSDNDYLLMKCIGYWKAMKNIVICNFGKSSLCKRFELMIFEEMNKKEGKNEKRLIGLYESYYLLSDDSIHENLAPIITSCLLKVASDKEESPETEKEVEMALLALSEGSRGILVKGAQHLQEITRIIFHHNDHRNLTQLAFQCAWRFMINNWNSNSNSQIVVVKYMNFLTVVKRELEELAKCVDWKREDEEKENSLAEPKATQIIVRWLDVLGYFFIMCNKWDDDFYELVRFIVELFRTARDNEQEISEMCAHALKMLAHNENSSVDAFEKCGVLDVISEELQQLKLENRLASDCLSIYLQIVRRLSNNSGDETDEEKRKELKRKMFEKLEEEGLEDVITSFHETLEYNQSYYDHSLSLNIFDYFVNV